MTSGSARPRQVLVLLGGWSAEREVSLSSGRECARALQTCGYRVRTVDVGRGLDWLSAAEDPPPDVIFNALHGRGGEDGTIQGVLECLGIPYTHSGVLASALAMDKVRAKQLFREEGLPVANGRVVDRAAFEGSPPLPQPYVIKPIDEGSSVGVRIVRSGDPPMALEAEDWPQSGQLLVEEYVPGRELTVAVMGERALGVLEIRADTGFYDYAAKYAPGGSTHIMPAPINPKAYEAACDIAVRAHRVLGCRGVSRADLRYDDTMGEPGRLVLLEVNTQPGMTPTSLVPDIANHAGIGFAELCRWMVEEARCDF